MATRSYRPPEEANSPKDMVNVDRVLIDGGEGDVSVARGTWDGKPHLLIRWNGNQDQPNGYPARVDNLLWLVVPPWMNEAVLDAIKHRIASDITAGDRDIPPGKER